MGINIAALAGSSGLMRTAATGATNVNGTTQLKGSGNAISDAFGMSSDDFLKLFLAQLQNQDPTQPMDDKAMLQELAQFTMISTLNDVQQALGGTQLAQASALIGKQVIGSDTSGKAASGTVDRIVQDSTGILLVLEGGAIVEPDSVTQVLDPTDASGTSSSSSSTTP